MYRVPYRLDVEIRQKVALAATLAGIGAVRTSLASVDDHDARTDRTPVRGVERPEERDRWGADQCRQMGNAGVVSNEKPCPLKDPRQLAERFPGKDAGRDVGEVGSERGDRILVGRPTGDRDSIAPRDQPARQCGEPLGRPPPPPSP